MQPVPLILVGNQINANQQNGREPLVDIAPRRDYVEIAQKLEGTLAGYDLYDATWYQWVRRIQKRVRLDFVEATYAVSRSTKHNVVYSTSEKVAIPLAAFLSLTQRKIPHIVMAHKLSSGHKASLFRIWPLHKSYYYIISDCRTQVDYAINQLGMPESNVEFVYHGIDHRFYRPQNVEVDDYILAVGQEQRDYKTLLQALAGTGIKLVIVPSSPWSTSKIHTDEIGETTILGYVSYRELRTLYARARLVVVPLFDVDYAAGNTTLLEAMAMAKPVIVTRISGITDYVVPNETGVYVSPGDAIELRNTILSIWDCPAEHKRLGTNARQMVEECMNLDVNVDRIVEIACKIINCA
jgi:glycosyltransferase involved in cell wall biosynthesis